MGHKPTLLVALLAIAMSISYVIVPTDGKFIFLVFMVVSWFLVAICWLAQKSADYITNQGYGHNEEKKS